MAVDPEAVEMAKFFTEINTTVPPKANAALKELEELDRKVKKKEEDAHKTKVDFLANYSTMSNDKRSKAFALLLQEITQISEIADKKVHIAQNAFTDISDVYDEFKTKQAKFIENCPRSPWKSPVNPGGSREYGDPSAGSRAEKRGRGRKRKEVPTTSDAIKREEGVDENVDEGQEKDQKMYCWCQLFQEKDDEMVCCENPGCKYEWYHFTCIGMLVAPVGDWYCTECRLYEQSLKKEQPTTSEKKNGVTPLRRGPKKKRFN